MTAVLNASTPGKRLLLIELNEFSVELLERGAQELGLRNVRRLLSMAVTETTTDDRVEHRGLDPWVQWVSVHTGQPSCVHGVLHLGDTPTKLGARQLWEVLSARGITSGIWGAMNATRGTADRCRFFLPDPWTFSEPAYPRRVNDLLALPRYYSKNYLDVSAWQFIKGTLRLIRYALGSGALLQMARLTPLILRGVASNGLSNAVLFSAFDLFSTALFIAKRRQDAPQFSLVFLNSIAHLQHHHWRDSPRLGNELRHGLQAIDRVLGMLFESRGEAEALIVMNALTQKNVSKDGPLVGYRQINPVRFLKAIGLEHARVEQLMTNDAHVFFETRAERDQAVGVLEQVQINGKPLFQAEPDPDLAHKLFYQIVFWDELARDVCLSINDRRIFFFEHFDILGIRTGAHVPNGQIYAEGIALPDIKYNHQLWESVCRFFCDPIGPTLSGDARG
jgi:hypothetical protein